MTLTFASSHHALTPETEAAIRGQIQTVSFFEPLALLDIMFASAERAHPRCRKVVLSDLETPFPAGAPFEVLRYDVDPAQPILSRARCWAEFLSHCDGHVILLDADVLIAANLEHVFRSSFDTALTTMRDERWPINAGIQFVHGGPRSRAKDFYERLLERMLEGEAAGWQWGGDQDALREMASRARFRRRATVSLHRENGFRIKLLPCSAYNFSTRDADMSDVYPDALALHFRGRRKRFMPGYWSQHLEHTPVRRLDARLWWRRQRMQRPWVWI